MVVQYVHRISGRPWILVSGRLEGGTLHIGDLVKVVVDGGPDVMATVKTIEVHSPPGLTTFGLDDSLAEVVRVGSEIFTP